MLTATSIEGRLLFPLSELLGTAAVPDDIAELDRDTDSFLNSVYFADSSIQPVENGYIGTVVLVVLEEIVIAPFGDVAGLVIGGGGGVSIFEARIRLQRLPGGFLFKISLYDVAVGLRISPSILRPLKPGTNEPEPADVSLDVQLGAVLIEFGTDQRFSVTWTGSPSIPRCMIGESGVIISVGSIRWLTPQSENLPADTPPAFLGMYLDNVGVELSNLEFDSNPSLFLDYAFIGRGGFTGRIDLPNLNLSGSLAGFKFTLQGFGITLVQNALTASDIRGTLTLPYFEKRLAIEIGLEVSGGFVIRVAGAAESDDSYDQNTGLLVLEKEDLFRVAVDSLTLALEDGIFTFKLSGEVTPLFAKNQISWPSFQVNELSIDSKGNVRLDGGWLTLREQKPLDFYGFQVEITQIGFGHTEDGGKWIGFSGGVKLVKGLSAGASVEGLRLIWYSNGSNRVPRLTFNGVGIEFEVPDVVEFKGKISYREPYEIEVPGFTQKEVVQRFDGEIKLKLITVNLEIDAKLVIGSVTSGPRGPYAFFAIYVGVELPTGIPLGNTGLALYGMAGLFALNMEPNKKPSEGWYENPDGGDGWYRRPEIGITDLAKKWDPNLGSIALGAGVTLGTLQDNGTTFHGKFLFVIVLPGPILMLEGRGDLLKKRAGSDDVTQEPVFRAIAIWDNRAGTLTFGLDARYKYDEEGGLVDIHGSTETYFNFRNPQDWHIFIGRKEPRHKRIQAKLFKDLFEANAYFMLQGANPLLQLGAWVGFDRSFNYGPASLSIQAFIQGDAVVSLKPTQFHGELLLHGSVKVGVFGVNAVLSVEASCVADVFDPFHIVFDFHVLVDLPFFLPDYKLDFTKEWGPEPIPPPLPLPLKEIAVEHLKVTTSWPLRRGQFLLPNYDSDSDDFLNPVTGITEPSVLGNIPVVPLDGKPHISFGRPMNDDALIGVNTQSGKGVWEIIGDPNTGTSPVSARFGLKELELAKYVGGASPWLRVAWAPNSGPPEDTTRLHGSWAPIPNGDGNNIDHVKLWLWSKNAFDYTRHGGRSWDEWFTSQFPNYPCVGPAPDREICCDVTGLDPTKQPSSTWQCLDHPDIVISWTTSSGDFDPSSWTISLPPGTRTVTITPATTHIGYVRHCISFESYPSGSGPNPRTEHAVRFTQFRIFPFATANTTIRSVGGPTSMALDCGSDLRITLPRPCDLVDLILTCSTSNAFIEAFTVDGLSTGRQNLTANVKPQLVQLKGNAITRIVVRGLNETFLHQLCYEHVLVTVNGSDGSGGDIPSRTLDDGTIELTSANGKDISHVHIKVNSEDSAPIDKVCVVFPPDPAEIIRREEISKHLVNELGRWSKIDDVLEPNTIYRLKVVTQVEAESNQELNGYTKTSTPQGDVYKVSQEQTEYAFFRTEGPPGITKLAAPSGHPTPDNFDSGLDDLTHYVHQTIPPTVPPVGEPPKLPRPVYRAYDVGVTFNENYVDLLYRMARRDLGLYLYDNNNQPVRDAQGRLIVLSNRWGVAENLTLTESDERWVKIVNDSTCAKLDEQTIPRSRTLTSASESQVLDADTVYEARLIPLLLHEDFATYKVGTVANGLGGILDGWTVKDDGTSDAPSRWEIGQGGTPPSNYVAQTSKISGGTNDGKDPAKPGAMLIRGDQDWTDYRLSAFLRSTNNDDAIGLVFRYREPNTYYRFSMDRERKYRRLVKVINGAHTILAEDDFVYRQNVDYLITIEAVGDSLRIYQDGALVFDAIDNAISSGRIGLYCWGHADARFSDVRVDDFRAAAPVPYRFKFTTSQFTNFFHHLHSYQDETWPTAVPATANIATLLGSAQVPTTQPTEDEFRAFENLVKQLSGIEMYKNPPNVQVARIEHDGQSVGFLVQSPEPIDWVRTDLKLASAGRWLPMPQVPGAVKLTDVGLFDTSPNDEYVTLLLREAIDLTNYRIEQRQLPTPLTESGDPPALLVDDFNAPESGVLFHEAFGPNALDHYIIVDEEPPGYQRSNWRVAKGRIEQIGDYRSGPASEYSQPRRPGTIALLNEGDRTNVRVSATVRSGQRDIGLVFRYKDGDNYYRLSMARVDVVDGTSSFRRLIKKVNGVVSVLWQDARFNDTSNGARLVIESFGDHLIGYLNEALLFSLRDPDIARGRVGFYCWGNRQAYLEGLQIETLESDPILWQPSFDEVQELEVVDEPGTLGGPSSWNASGGVLTQSSFIQSEDGSWQAPVSGLATDIAVGADGSIWATYMATTTGYDLYRWNGNSWALVAVSPVGGVRIAVDADGVPWVVDDAQRIYSWDGNRFQLLLGAAHDIAIGPTSPPFIVGTNPVPGGFGIYYWDDGTWQAIDGGGVKIAVGPDGRLWVVNDAGQILVLDWTRGTWQHLPGTARDISVGVNGDVWIVGTEPTIGGFRVYRWNGVAWEEVPGAGGIEIAAGPTGTAWAVTDAQRTARWVGNIHSKAGTYTLGGEEWNDVQISARLHPRGSGAMGIIFRHADASNYYRFSMDRQGNYRRLIKKVDGKISVLWEDQFQFTVGQIYELTIRALDEWLSIYLDGVLLKAIHDDEVKRGRVGLYCHANTGARYERLLVIDPIRRVGRWTIEDEAQGGDFSQWRLSQGELTQASNYGDGDAFTGTGTLAVAGDPGWTHYQVAARMRSDTDDTLGLIFRYVDKDNYYRLSLDAEHNIRRLVKKVNGVVSRLREKPGSFMISESFTLRVEVVGSRLIGRMNDDDLFEVTDNTHAAGHVGLYCWQNSAAHFERVEVRQPSLEASALWRDRFTESDLSGWQFDDHNAPFTVSKWATVDGALLHQFSTPLPGIEARSLFGNSDWTNVMIRVRLQSQDDGAIGVLFRYRDANNHYRVNLDVANKRRQLIKTVAGSSSILWEGSADLAKGQTYDLAIVAMDDLLRGYLNGLPMFVVADSDLLSGQTGLYCSADNIAQFSQVRVYPADRAFNSWLLDEPFDFLLPDRWTFVDDGNQQGPSRWEIQQGELRQTSNLHGGSTDPAVPDKPGAHALAGNTNWTDYRLATRLSSDNASGAIGVIFRFRDKDNYYRFSMDHKGGYRRLIKKTKGVVTTLWDDGFLYQVGREYLLTIDCVGGQLTIYLDGERICYVDDTDHGAGLIGLYCWANNGARFSEVRVAAPVWVPHYVFNDEVRMPAGTRLRVYSGSAKNLPVAPPGMAQRFLAPINEMGQSYWHKPGGVTLRLRARGEVTGHTRHFISNDPKVSKSYQELAATDLRILRKRDGTGFILMVVPSGSGTPLLQYGQYRLTMTYHRKKPSANNTDLTLSQAGNSDPEEVWIDIPWQAN